jgi:hypothetical protein
MKEQSRSKQESKIMPGWRREGASWVRRAPGMIGIVKLGRGGWHWIIVDVESEQMLRMSSASTRRSRKSRRTVQKLMLALEKERRENAQ